MKERMTERETTKRQDLIARAKAFIAGANMDTANMDTALKGAFLFLAAVTLMMTNWQLVIGNWQPQSAYFIDKVQVVEGFPVDDATLSRVLRREPVATFAVDVYREGVWKLPFQANPTFRQQVTEHFIDAGIIKNNPPKLVMAQNPEDSVAGKRLVFFADIPAAKIAGFKHPVFYIFSVKGSYKVYADGTQIYAGDGSTVYLQKGLIPKADAETLRLTVVITNTRPEYLDGPVYRHGIAILPESEFSSFIGSEPYKENFVLTWLAAMYGTLAAVMSLFALATGFVDVAAFAVVTLCFGVIAWMELPAFFMGKSGFEVNFWRVVVYGLFVSAINVQTLAFFRLQLGSKRPLLQILADGYAQFSSHINSHSSSQVNSHSSAICHPQAKTLRTTMSNQIPALDSPRVYAAGIMGTAAFLVFIYVVLVAKLEVRPPLALSQVNIGFSLLLVVSQWFAFRLGFASLSSDHQRALAKADERVGDALAARLRSARVYGLAMLCLCGFYAVGLPMKSFSVGTDVWLAASIAPVASITTVIFVTVLQAAKTSRLFKDQIKMIHYYVEKLGPPAFERKFCGVLVISDLAGMGAASEFLARHTQGLRALAVFIEKVHLDLVELFLAGHTTFNEKTNGDQNILMLNAVSTDHADEILTESLRRWIAHGETMLGSWREHFVSLASAEAKTDARLLAEKLDLHIFLGTYDDMIIQRVQGKLDSLSDHWTKLAALEKFCFHNRVGFRQRDRRAVERGLGEKTSIEVDASGRMFVTWESAIKRGAGSPKLSVVPPTVETVEAVVTKVESVTTVETVETAEDHPTSA